MGQVPHVLSSHPRGLRLALLPTLGTQHRAKPTRAYVLGCWGSKSEVSREYKRDFSGGSGGVKDPCRKRGSLCMCVGACAVHASSLLVAWRVATYFARVSSSGLSPESFP